MMVPQVSNGFPEVAFGRRTEDVCRSRSFSTTRSEYKASAPCAVIGKPGGQANSYGITGNIECGKFANDWFGRLGDSVPGRVNGHVELLRWFAQI
jgi:hypothetical protein